MRLVKNNHNIPAPEPDSIPDSSSPDSSSPEAGSIPEESSPEADSISDKLGKIRLRVIVNHQYSKAMIKKKLLKLCTYLFLQTSFFESFLRVLITAKSKLG